MEINLRRASCGGCRALRTELNHAREKQLRTDAALKKARKACKRLKERTDETL